MLGAKVPVPCAHDLLGNVYNSQTSSPPTSQLLHNGQRHPWAALKDLEVQGPTGASVDMDTLLALLMQDYAAGTGWLCIRFETCITD